MKFATAIAVLATAATVSASVTDTNASRLARGLPLKSPLRRSTPVSRAKRGTPSGTPSSGDNNQCSTGPTQCCNSVEHANGPASSSILGSLGLQVADDVLVGVTCSPLSAIGVGGSSCSQQPVCCNNNNFNGLIVIGCTPINISL